MFESRRIKRMNREGLSRQPRNKAFYGNETARWARDAPKKSSSAWLHHRKWKKSATKIYVSPHEGKEVEKRMCVCKFYTRSRKSEPWYVCNVRTRLSDVSNLCALLCTGEIKIFMECTFECCFCAVGFFFLVRSECFIVDRSREAVLLGDWSWKRLKFKGVVWMLILRVFWFDENAYILIIEIFKRLRRVTSMR